MKIDKTAGERKLHCHYSFVIETGRTEKTAEEFKNFNFPTFQNGSSFKYAFVGFVVGRPKAFHCE
jgi:hypothetical protein